MESNSAVVISPDMYAWYGRPLPAEAPGALLDQLVDVLDVLAAVDEALECGPEAAIDAVDHAAEIGCDFVEPADHAAIAIGEHAFVEAGIGSQGVAGRDVGPPHYR